jgi:S1-C subfamily serine protease
MAFRSIAEQGYAPAQYELAMLYHYGYGVSKDYKAAIRWYRKAANQGHRISQNMLAALAEGNQPPRSRQARKSPRPSPARRSDPNKIVSASSGTGFAVSSNGHVITNHHVIEGCQKVRIHHKGKSIPATVVTFDPRNDLALLKGDFRPSTVFSLSNASPELLQDVYVAGFPFGRKVSTSVKVTKGIISSLTGIGNNFSNIQIDAALQSGNSGGPILDEKGNVVGVAVARLDKMYALKNYGSLPENTNFGIKTNVVRSILESSNVSLPSPNRKSISKTKLGKMISDATYYLSCWMTMAQIEKMRSKKVIFQNLN